MQQTVSDRKSYTDMYIYKKCHLRDKWSGQERLLQVVDTVKMMWSIKTEHKIRGALGKFLATSILIAQAI